MTTEPKKSKNPFINAARNAAVNPSVPGAKTTQVQKAKFKPAVMTAKPARKTAGRGR
jgi:hypothetical protein